MRALGCLSQLSQCEFAVVVAAPQHEQAKDINEEVVVFAKWGLRN
jgi:hypothetical protein